VIRQIALALREVHRKGIIHLDIKESNILINFNKDNQYFAECAKLPIEFKLADWGVSRDMSKIKPKEFVVYRRGTPRFMSPESNIQQNVADPYKVEVYSLGIVLFRLIFKVYPFSPSSFEDMNARDNNFVRSFLSSEKNVNKV
jgi:serine/threonine protein kinase